MEFRTVTYNANNIRESLAAQSNEITLEMTVITHRIGINMHSVFTHVYYDIFLNIYVLYMRTLTFNLLTMKDVWTSKMYVINKKLLVIIADLHFLQCSTVHLVRSICSNKGYSVVKRWLKNMNGGGFLLK